MVDEQIRTFLTFSRIANQAKRAFKRPTRAKKSQVDEAAIQFYYLSNSLLIRFYDYRCHQAGKRRKRKRQKGASSVGESIQGSPRSSVLFAPTFIFVRSQLEAKSQKLGTAPALGRQF
ncbi:hypothetical protein KM043_012697 [Ampulex compressa]|nr:hypothetical protein KM043_012697 [Ampulex compressa]